MAPARWVVLGSLGGVWTALPARVSGSGRRRQAARATAAEVRALWVTRSSLTTPASVASLVTTARDQGFNTLLVQVRGRADAYYTTDLEPRSADLTRQPANFDPLASVLTEAKASGIRVHAWVNLNLVSSAVELPAAPDHLVYRHPEWLMVPRVIAQDVARLDPSNPGYVGKIARWTRGQLETVEGLYASPLQPEAAAHTERVLVDLARRYDLDGVHLDYARYPNQHSTTAVSRSRIPGRHPARLGADARRELDAEAENDLFAYPDRLPAEWKAFRRARLTALITRISRSVRAARPGVLVTSAVVADPQDAFDERLQDWRGWLAGRVIDAVAPMAYTQEPARFAEQIAAARNIAGGGAVWAGIGSYRLSPAQTIENIQAARKLGAAGFVLFSYDSLTGPKPPAPDYLETVSRPASARLARQRRLRSSSFRLPASSSTSIESVGELLESRPPDRTRDRVAARFPPPRSKSGAPIACFGTRRSAGLRMRRTPPARLLTLFDLASLTKVIATATLVDARRRRRHAGARRSRRGPALRRGAGPIASTSPSPISSSMPRG